MRYTVYDLLYDFPDEKSCLIWLFEFRYPDGYICKKCLIVTKHYFINGRKVFSCSVCNAQVSPMVGTIFERSHVPLRSWFYAIYQMATNKAGTSARQLEREIGVTYKTAWRMMHQVRKMMSSPSGQLSGEVEVDETFIHPNTFKRSSARLRYGYDARRTGEVVFGIVERGGRVKVWHVKSTGARVLQPIIREHVDHGSMIFTDGYMAYRRLPEMGFYHNWTDHGKGQRVDGENHTQNIENVWSHLKRGIKGVYRHIGKSYIQAYADEYAWRYSNRNKPSMFWSLMSQVV